MLGSGGLGDFGLAGGGTSGTVQKLTAALSFTGSLSRSVTQKLMATLFSNFPNLSVIDSFKRAPEEPLSNGGRWSKIYNGELGYIKEEAWGNPSGLLMGGYWNAAEQINPAVSVDITGLPGTNKSVLLYCCLQANLWFYEVQVTETSSGKFTFTLKKAKRGGGISEIGVEGTTILATASGVALAVGDAIGLSVREGIVRTWKRRAGGWTQVQEVADSAATSGFCGFGGSTTILKFIKLTNFSFGEMPGYVTLGHNLIRKVVRKLEASLSFVGTVPRTTSHRLTAGLEFVGTLPYTIAHRLTAALFPSKKASFPTLGVVDSFVRAYEKPLSNGGKWEKAPSAYNTGEIKVGADRWNPSGISSSAALWNVAEQVNPAVSAEVSGTPTGEHRNIGVWCCLSKTAVSGYFLRYEMEPPGMSEKYTITLEKWEAGIKTILATQTAQLFEKGDSIGISQREGILRGWRKHAGIWTQVLEASDATYTTGYTGIEGSGPGAGSGTFNNFSFGEILAVTESAVSLGHNVAHQVKAGLEFLGTLRKEFAFTRKLGAALSFAGSLPRKITHQLKAVLEFAGSITPHKIIELIVKKLEAALSFTGTLPRMTAHGLTAALSFIGALARSIQTTFSPKLGFAGALPRNIIHGLTASLSFLGSLIPVKATILKTLTASLSFVGTLPRRTTRGLEALLGFSTSLLDHTIYPLMASLEFAGTLRKEFDLTKRFEASLSFLGTLPRKIAHTSSAALTFEGALGKALSKGLKASLSFVGTLPKVTTHTLVATLDFLGTLPSFIIKEFSSSLSFVGTLPRNITSGLRASLSFIASLPHRTFHRLEASLTFVVSLPRTIGHRLSAVLSFTGSMTHSIVQGFKASLTFVGTLPRNMIHGTEAVLSFLGGLVPENRLEKVMKLVASLSFKGSLPRNITHGLKGELSFIGGLDKVLSRSLQASLSFVATLPRNIRHQLEVRLRLGGVHMWYSAVVHFFYGTDQLIVKREPSSFTIVPFSAKPIDPDELVRPEPFPDLTEISPGTVEEDLTGYPYAHVPDAESYPLMKLKKPSGGLEERTQPSSVEDDLILPEAKLVLAGNKFVKIIRDLISRQ